MAVRVIEGADPAVCHEGGSGDEPDFLERKVANRIGWLTL
jgi:hypothetical protein